jgi:hypothetical protein
VKKILSFVITLAVGLLTLAGYFFKAALSPIIVRIVAWGILLMGTAAMIGIAALIRSHLMRIVHKEKGFVHSIVLILALLFALIGGFALTTDSPFFRDFILNVQVPIEASLLALLAVTLLYTSIRLIRNRGWTLMSGAFLCSAIISLILDLGFIRTVDGSFVDSMLAFLERLPMAGARGILFGMALGGLVVGLRALFSMEQPEGE